MFFQQLRQAAATLVLKIQAHPFNGELADGSLPSEKFTYYLTQDSLYLAEFARALTLTAARLPAQHSRQFIEFALDALQAEQDLHQHYLHKTANTAVQSPTCFMYSNYLLTMASTAAIEVAVASSVPCFWIYQLVGQQLAATNHDRNNPYQAWIDLYASASYASSVQKIIVILEALAASASALTQASMRSAFMRATQLEWLFWDSAYRLEAWPI